MFTQDHIKSIYLTSVSLIGSVLVIASLVNSASRPDAPSTLVLVLLLLMAAVFQFSTLTLGSKSYEIGTVIALAGGALYGPSACVLIAASSALTMVLKTTLDNSFPWPRFPERLGFNNGMFVIAGFIASSLFFKIVDYADNLFWYSISWLLTGIVFHWINVALLAVMLQIQGIQTFRKTIQDTASADWWNMLINGLGAGLFATAVSMTGATGVVIFAFPLVLMVVSVRIIIRDAEAQQARLEKEVADRTEDLRQANDRLQNLLVQKNRFLSILSHDMKTPLTAIRLYGQMLKTAPRLKDRQRDKIATTILDSENNLTDLVSNVLDVERMQADTEMVMEFKRFDWAETVASSLATLELQAQRKQIMLKYHGVVAGIELEGDQSKLRRVALNLLSNAVKYTPEGGRIEVTLKDQGQTVLLKVADSGYGIPTAQLDSIFEPYHRVEENNQYAAGTGLGLSVVKMIVEGHGGQIMVESMVNEGSTFAVTLLKVLDGEGGDSAEIPNDTMTIDVSNATPPQLDTQPSSPHPQQNESEAPEQTHTPGRADASQL